MPVDRGAIDAQLREIGEGERWWEQREFRDLPHVLHAEERIRGIVNGWLVGSRLPRVRPGGRWLVVATDQRLLCLRQERFARKQVEVAPGQIVGVVQSARLRSYQITLDTQLRRYRIRIPKEEAFRFAAALAPLLPDAAPRGAATVPDFLSWMPGIDTVASLPGASGIVRRIGMLSPPDAPPRDRMEHLESVVDRLQGDVERLQQQVAFLEGLLQKRAEAAATWGGPGEPDPR